MKRLLLFALLLLPTSAFAQCNGIFANNTICGNVTGTPNLPRPTSPSAFIGAAGGSNGQIQYNTAGALGGFTAGGDLTFSVPNFTVALQAITNGKLFPAAQNTIKGAAVSSAIADLAVPSCSATANGLQWVSGTGLQCATLGTVSNSSTSVVGDLAAFANTNATSIASTGYNAKQVPGLIPATSTVTISNASPGVVTWTSHGLSANDTVFFCTTGALPTGLTACSPAVGTTSANVYTQNPTLYYVVGSSITTNTFTVATSIANAKAGTAVNTSSAGSGTHTAFANAMACTGCVGEAIWSAIGIGSGVAIAIDTPTIWTTLSLTPGLWQITGNNGYYGNTFTAWHGNINNGLGAALSTAPYDGIAAEHVTVNATNGIIVPFTPRKVFITSTTTINAVGSVTYAAGTAIAYGIVHAERVK